MHNQAKNKMDAVFKIKSSKPRPSSRLANLIRQFQSGALVSDWEFDAVYPDPVQKISEFHFTPVAVAMRAAAFLVSRPGVRVLDVGSGAGKFCLIGAASTDGHFTGVEQRRQLHLLAKKLSADLGLNRAVFLHGNISKTDFTAFDAVYLFNPFFEHIDQTDPIDQSVPLNRELYHSHCAYVRQQLDQMPAGTRLATYFSHLDEVPDSFSLLETDFDGKLKFWKKTV